MSFFTRDWFVNKQTSNAWTSSLKLVPEKFSNEHLKTYLIDSRDKTFDKESLRAYKSLKAFKYFKDGYVQKFKTAVVKDDAVSTENLFLCKANVMASMARKQYIVYTCINSSSGRVLGGSCECVAGKGEACSHVAAVLFALDDFVSEGLNTVPDDATCTDRLKKWNKPADRIVQAKTVEDIHVHQPKFGVKEKQKHRKADPRHPLHRSLDTKERDKLHATIQKLLPQCGFAKYGVHEPIASVSDSEHKPSVCDSSNSISLGFFSIFPPSKHDIEEACSKYKASLQVTDKEIIDIQTKTLSQSKSPLWHQVRSVRITASNFHAVVKRRPSTNPKCLLRKLLGYNSSGKKAAMKFGLEAESQATERYLEYLQLQTGNTYCAKEVGFRISKDYPYLGASADRILEDPARGLVLVELKNPMSTWDNSIEEACNKLPCLKFDENKTVTLNQNHSYFTQVQGQMAVYDIPICDFVLCTKEEIFVETIKFDQALWAEYVKKLEHFYTKIMLPEIVYPSLMYGNEPLVLD